MTDRMAEPPPTAVVNQDRQGTVVALTGQLTINEADTRRTELAASLSSSAELMLDVGGLDDVDIAGLQLLIALRRSGERAGKLVALTARAEGALLAALTAAGFCDPGEGGPGSDGRPSGPDGFWDGRT